MIRDQLMSADSFFPRHGRPGPGTAAAHSGKLGLDCYEMDNMFCEINILFSTKVSSYLDTSCDLNVPLNLKENVIFFQREFFRDAGHGHGDTDAGGAIPGAGPSGFFRPDHCETRHYPLSYILCPWTLVTCHCSGFYICQTELLLVFWLDHPRLGKA